MKQTHLATSITVAEFQELLKLCSRLKSNQSQRRSDSLTLQFANEQEAERFIFLLERLAGIEFLQ